MALVYLATTWLTGVLLGLSARLPGPLPPLLFVCFLALALTWWRRPLPRWLFLCAAVAGIGLWRADLSQAPLGPRHVAHRNGTEVALRGTVDAEPEVRHSSQRLTLRVQALSDDAGETPAEGLVLVSTRRYPEFRYGDVLDLSGRLETPPEFDGFSYKDYLARQGIHSLSRFPRIQFVEHSDGNPLWAIMLDVRRTVRMQLERALPGPHAALAAALLLGERADLPDELVDAFRVTGVSHVLAVSGWQVSLVVGLVGGIGGSLLRRRHALRFATAASLICAYVLLVGASPAVVRAGLMGGAALAAVALGRPRDGLNALAIACLVATAWDPTVVLDVGFRLSALATLGLIVLSPRLRPLAERLPLWAGSVLAMTIAAELMVLPVLAAEFGQISLVSLFTNLAVVPLVPGAMEWAAVAALLGALWSPLGQLPAALASLYLGAAVWVVEGLASQPLAALTVSAPHPLAVVVYYTGLGLLIDGGKRARPLVDLARARLPAVVPRRAVLLAAGAIVVAASGLVLRTDDALRVSVLDVGQGDAILVRTPTGRHVLVDGGPDGVGVQNALARRLPFGSKTVDVLVLTHPHDDHLVGLIDVLQTYRIGQVLQGPAPEKPSPAYRRWAELSASLGVPVVHAQSGQTVDLGGGARLRVVHAGEAWTGVDDQANDASVAILIERGAFSLLVPGDGGPPVQRWMRDRGEVASLTAFKVPHHGAPGSVDRGFLEATSPRAAIISVGRQNRFGHPSVETLNLLAPAEVYRTDLHGSIELTVNPDGSYRFERSRS